MISISMPVLRSNPCTMSRPTAMSTPRGLSSFGTKTAFAMSPKACCMTSTPERSIEGLAARSLVSNSRYADCRECDCCSRSESRFVKSSSCTSYDTRGRCRLAMDCDARGGGAMVSLLGRVRLIFAARWAVGAPMESFASSSSSAAARLAEYWLRSASCRVLLMRDDSSPPLAPRGIGSSGYLVESEEKQRECPKVKADDCSSTSYLSPLATPDLETASIRCAGNDCLPCYLACLAFACPGDRDLKHGSVAFSAIRLGA